VKIVNTSRRQVLGLLILALVITIASYARTLSFEFVYDDVPQVAENEFIKSWPGCSAILTQHEWAHVFADGEKIDT
jgi:hypothetical protein